MCAADVCITYDGRADEVNVASLAVQIDIALSGNPLDLSGIVATCIAVLQSNLTLYHCVSPWPSSVLVMGRCFACPQGMQRAFVFTIITIEES